MRRMNIAPNDAARWARRQPDETPRQHRQRVLARAAELRERARRGETPEEIIDKGLALAEIKRLRPWTHEGLEGFKGWVRKHLPYQVARANQYSRVAAGIGLALVAGKNVCFDQLLAIITAPPERYEELIAAAEAGASKAALLRMISGGEAREREKPSAGQQVLELLKKDMSREELEAIERVVRQRLGRGSTSASASASTSTATATATATSGPGPKVDPNGSSVAALCADYQPPPCPYQLPDIDVPAHWPRDYPQRWLATLRDHDDIILCAQDATQYGTLGRMLLGGRFVGLDLNGCHGLWLFGAPSSGKTYAADCITHMAL